MPFPMRFVRLRTSCDRMAVLSLLIIVAVAGALRLPGLDERSLWFDEGYSIALATEFPVGEIVTRTGHDFHPPFYFLLLRGWSAVVGTSVPALRLLSVLFGLVAVAGMLALPGLGANTSCSERKPEAHYRVRFAGLTGAAVLAISASQIRWSQEVRMYALGATLAILSTVALGSITSAGRSRWAWCVLYVATATAFLYTHYFAVFTLLAHGLWAGGVFLTGVFERWRFRRPPANAFWPLVCVACAAALFAPWLPVLTKQRSSFQDEFWSGTDTPWSVPSALYKLFFPLNASWTPEHLPVVACMALLAIVLVMCLLCRSRDAVLTVLCAVVPVVGMAIMSSVGRSVASSRYLLFAYPFFIAAIAQAVARWVPRRFQVLIVTLLLLDGALIANRYSHSVNTQDDTSVKGAADYLRAASRPRDFVVVMHPCILSSLRSYLGRDWNVRLYAPAEQIPVYLGTAILQNDDFVKPFDFASGTSVWVVDSTGYGHPPHHRIPENWAEVDADTRAFRGVYFFERFVTVRRYRVSQQKKSDPVTRPEGRAY